LAVDRLPEAIMKTVASRLSDYFRAVGEAAKPFDWGNNNCAHFCMNWHVFLGQERKVVLPPFASKAATRKFFVENNLNLQDIVTKESGLELIAPSFVRPGDIVLFEMPTADFIALGIYVGSHVAFLNEDGEVEFDNVNITTAWRTPSVYNPG
jgi:hypothetical protein